MAGRRAINVSGSAFFIRSWNILECCTSSVPHSFRWWPVPVQRCKWNAPQDLPAKKNPGTSPGLFTAHLAGPCAGASGRVPICLGVA